MKLPLKNIISALISKSIHLLLVSFRIASKRKTVRLARTLTKTEMISATGLKVHLIT